MGEAGTGSLRRAAPRTSVSWHARIVPALLLAGLYWAAGQLALLMAIPPGYATAVWPAAGLALVGVLVGGKRVAPGVVLGSFLVNVETALDASDAGALVQSLVVPLGLGLGAAAQALAGASVIRRFVGASSPLDDAPAIARFLVLGGLAACVVGATVGASVLCAAQIVDWTRFPITWGTWWIGDTIGVLIFAPLALIFVGRPRGIWWRRRFVLGGSLSVAFAMVTLIFVYASRWEQSRLESDFERRATTIARPLDARLEIYQNLVLSIAGLFESSEEVTPDEFATFVRRALATYPGIQGLSWNPVVTASERPRFEHTARAVGAHDFQITERDGTGALVPATFRPEHVVVRYIEPAASNERAVGFDIASDTTRSDAIARARQTGAPTVTARIRLVQERGSQNGVLLLVPVHEQPLDGRGITQRVRGYVVGVFRVGEVVERALDGIDRSGVAVSLLDANATPAEQLLYSSTTDINHQPASRFQWHRDLEFGGRTWTLVATSTTP